MQRWVMVTPGTKFDRKIEVVRIDSSCAEFLDPNFNLDEEDHTPYHSDQWYGELSDEIFLWLCKQGVERDVADELADIAAIYHPWTNANFVVLEVGK